MKQRMSLMFAISVLSVFILSSVASAAAFKEAVSKEFDLNETLFDKIIQTGNNPYEAAGLTRKQERR